MADAGGFVAVAACCRGSCETTSSFEAKRVLLRPNLAVQTRLRTLCVVCLHEAPINAGVNLSVSELSLQSSLTNQDWNVIDIQSALRITLMSLSQEYRH